MANIALGDIKTWSKKYVEAQEHYLKAIELGKLPQAYLKLALLKIAQEDYKSAFNFILLYKRQCTDSSNLNELLEAETVDAPALLNLIVAEFFQLGQKWDMGFQKSHIDIVPNTAFETTMLSWIRRPNPVAVEIMLKCLEPTYMQGELLPVLLKGIELGVLSDRLIYTTANLAYNHYDHLTASTILKAMKKAHK